MIEGYAATSADSTTKGSILVTGDDGYYGCGMESLLGALQREGYDAVLVGSAKDQSVTGHSMKSDSYTVRYGKVWPLSQNLFEDLQTWAEENDQKADGVKWDSQEPAYITTAWENGSVVNIEQKGKRVTREPIKVSKNDREMSPICDRLAGCMKEPATRWRVDGTPAVCTLVGMKGLGKNIVAVVSGINDGVNIGKDHALTSGTIAAARQAVLTDRDPAIPPPLALAVSLNTYDDPENSQKKQLLYDSEISGVPQSSTIKYWDTANKVVVEILRRFLGKDEFHNGSVYNINVPNQPPEKKMTIAAAPLGERSWYLKRYPERSTEHGGVFELGARISGAMYSEQGLSGEDDVKTATRGEGVVTVTPLLVDTMDQNRLRVLSRHLSNARQSNNKQAAHPSSFKSSFRGKKDFLKNIFNARD